MELGLIALGLGLTATAAFAEQCDTDAVLQQQVYEFNKFAAICENAAIQEDNFEAREVPELPSAGDQ